MCVHIVYTYIHILYTVSKGVFSNLILRSEILRDDTLFFSFARGTDYPPSFLSDAVGGDNKSTAKVMWDPCCAHLYIAYTPFRRVALTTRFWGGNGPREYVYIRAHTQALQTFTRAHRAPGARRSVVSSSRADPYRESTPSESELRTHSPFLLPRLGFPRRGEKNKKKERFSLLFITTRLSRLRRVRLAAFPRIYPRSYLGVKVTYVTMTNSRFPPPARAHQPWLVPSWVPTV